MLCFFSEFREVPGLGVLGEAVVGPDAIFEPEDGGAREAVLSAVQPFIDEAGVVLVLSDLDTPFAPHLLHNTFGVSAEEAAQLASRGLPVTAMGAAMRVELHCDYRGGQVMHRDGAFNYDFDLERAAKNLGTELSLFIDGFMTGMSMDDPGAASPAGLGAQVVADVLTVGEEELVVNSM